jgi:hypothetical protein
VTEESTTYREPIAERTTAPEPSKKQQLTMSKGTTTFIIHHKSVAKILSIKSAEIARITCRCLQTSSPTMDDPISMTAETRISRSGTDKIESEPSSDPKQSIDCSTASLSNRSTAPPPPPNELNRPIHHFNQFRICQFLIIFMESISIKLEKIERSW